jgi:hypothetical protein
MGTGPPKRVVTRQISELKLQKSGPQDVVPDGGMQPPSAAMSCPFDCDVQAFA